MGGCLGHDTHLTPKSQDTALGQNQDPKPHYLPSVGKHFDSALCFSRFLCTPKKKKRCENLTIHHPKCILHLEAWKFSRTTQSRQKTVVSHITNTKQLKWTHDDSRLMATLPTTPLPNPKLHCPVASSRHAIISFGNISISTSQGEDSSGLWQV